jgi:hypothetical protein
MSAMRTVTHQLLHAPLADKAVAAIHLHAVVGHFQTGLGHKGFADRREEGEQVSRSSRCSALPPGALDQATVVK